MALISSQRISETGITPTLTTIETAANTFTNSGFEFILIKNSGEANQITITATTTEVDIQGFGDLTKSNAVLSIGAGATSFIGPFPLGAFQGTDSAVTFTFSNVDGIQVAILTTRT